MSDVGLIAQAVAEIAKVVGNWQVSAERKKLQAAVEAAEKYIMVNEKVGEFENITEKKQKQLLAHYRHRFFAYN